MEEEKFFYHLEQKVQQVHEIDKDYNGLDVGVYWALENIQQFLIHEQQAMESTTYSPRLVC